LARINRPNGNRPYNRHIGPNAVPTPSLAAENPDSEARAARGTLLLDSRAPMADVKYWLNCGPTEVNRMALSRSSSSRAVLLLGGLLLGLPGPAPVSLAAGDGRAPNDADRQAQEEFFETKIRPLLVNRCFDCHGKDKSKGGLRLDGRDAMLKGAESGPVVLPGKPDESSLIAAIRYAGEVQMPPKGKLPDNEIAALTEWVKRGAFWPTARPSVASRATPASTSQPTTTADAPAYKLTPEQRSFWAFQPVRIPTPPPVTDDAWPRSAIDRFILAKLEENDLAPAPMADKRTLIRRASFDLLGLPPCPEDVADFLRDQSPDAFARVVDRLLASPHHGERWGRYWLDVARYGEDQAHSFQPRLYPHGYRYRDWVVRALNRDVPYDRFILEQVAGDLIDGPDRQDRIAALGFFACGPVYYGDAQRHDQYADRIDTLTRGFLGLTVACARCHDHKYDPIPTTDYYALEGVFASTDYVEVPAAPREEIDAYNNGQSGIQAKDKEITAFVKSEAERLKLKVQANAQKQVERMLGDEAQKKLVSLRAELAVLKKKAPPKYPVIHTLADASQAKDMPFLIRGNASTPGAKVKRHFLTVLGGDKTPFARGSGRLELARAIASSENPLTARVMVNRVWQHHFGRGLVASCSNFGVLGEKPSHPELLDWLADRFVKSGWSLKALHREIMLSSTYRQSCRIDSSGESTDPANVLLWRMNRRRLDVEAWRDAILAVAGRLDASIGGPSVSLESPANARRTLYAAISRHDLAWVLRLFDFPDPNISSGGRVETIVPLQQLFVLNSEFMVANARAVASRLSEPGHARALRDEDRIDRAYLLLFGRRATEHELKLGLTYLRQTDPAGGSRPDMTRWDRYAQALLATNEFLFVD
jgi:mono/diheme cytochrome c family protein